MVHQVKKVSSATGASVKALRPNRLQCLGAGDTGPTPHLRACSDTSPTGDLRHRRA